MSAAPVAQGATAGPCADPARLARLLREAPATDATASDASEVRFSAACRNALRRAFDRFDVDGDEALSFAELKAVIALTEGETLAPAQFDSLCEMLETTPDGRVTFEGFLSLYRCNYGEVGPVAADKSLWKDLQLFGFAGELQSKLEADLPTPAEAETVAVASKPVARRNAFELLGKKRPAAAKGRARKVKQPRPADPAPAAQTKTKTTDPPAAAAAAAAAGPEAVKTIEAIDVDEGTAVKPLMVDDRPPNPFFSKRQPKRVYAIVDQESGPMPSAREWVLPAFPVAPDVCHVGAAPYLVDTTQSAFGHRAPAATEPGMLASATWSWPPRYDPEAMPPHGVVVRVTPLPALSTAAQVVAHPEVRKIAFGDGSVDYDDDQGPDNLADFATAKLRGNGLPWAHQFRDAMAPSLWRGSTALNQLETWLRTCWNTNMAAAPRPSKRRNYTPMFSDEGSNSSWEPDDGSNVSIQSRALCGPIGATKTDMVRHSAETIGFDVIEIHPGVSRSSANLKQLFGEATRSRSIGKKNDLSRSLILVDEVDIFFEEDKGFVAWLRSLLASARCPLVFTCNAIPAALADVFEEKGVQVLAVDKPPTARLAHVLRQICAVHGVHASLKDLSQLAEHKGGDLRACLNQLQLTCHVAADAGASPEPGQASASIIDVTTPIKAGAAPIVSAQTESDPVQTTMLAIAGTIEEREEQRALGRSDAGAAEEVLACAIELQASQAPSPQEGREPGPAALSIPLLRKARPSQGTMLGGTRITVSGQGFWPEGAQSVTLLVDGVACLDVSVESDTLVHCTTPAAQGKGLVEAAPSTPTHQAASGHDSGEDIEDDDDDDIEDDDDDDEDFATPPVSKRHPKSLEPESSPHKRMPSNRKPSKQRVRDTVAARLARGRRWPRAITMEVRMLDGSRRSSLSRPEWAQRGLFEYVPAPPDPTPAVPATASEPALPPGEASSAPHDRAAAEADLSQLAELAQLADDLSLLNTFHAPEAQAPLLDDPWAVDRFRGDHVSPGEQLWPALRAEHCRLVLGAKRLDAALEATTLALPPAVGLSRRQRRYFASAQAVVSRACSNVALGAGRGAGLLRRDRLHPTLGEWFHYLRVIDAIEGARKDAKSTRRFRHYLQRLLHSEPVLEALEAHQALPALHPS